MEHYMTGSALVVFMPDALKGAAVKTECDALRAIVEKAEGVRSVQVRLDKIAALDVAGIQILAGLTTFCRDKGAELSLAGVSPDIKELLASMKLDLLWKVV